MKCNYMTDVQIVDDVEEVIAEKMKNDSEDAFFVADLSDVVRKLDKWKRLLPRVDPHYAVKCNDDISILSMMVSLGMGFDCASKAEIERIIGLNVDPSRIIYANPCKQNSHIRMAAKNGVSLTTFDNEEELYKIAKVHPECQLVLRILPPDDIKAQCQLGMKYGAHPKNWEQLLLKAKELKLNVVGVSFHVGSGCYEATAFSAAVRMAHDAFCLAKTLGFEFNLLDIGGGFPGHVGAPITFEEIVSDLKPTLDELFPEESGIRIIAEPGRYFVASALTLVVNVIAKRETENEQGEKSIMYYVNDGVYGSFNCLLYDHAEVTPEFKQNYTGIKHDSSVWGPTCDGLDCLNERIRLPELFVGDWLVYKNMGAYTMCAASNFNGMPKPNLYYVVLNGIYKKLKNPTLVDNLSPPTPLIAVKA